jgi:hypothetical protein
MFISSSLVMTTSSTKIENSCNIGYQIWCKQKKLYLGSASALRKGLGKLKKE